MLRKKRGLAIIEFLFFFFVFIFFFALMYGSWGVTQSSILRSIGARAYAWDVIRNRSNLAFVRDNVNIVKILENNYWGTSSRVFASVDNNPDFFRVKKLKIDMGGSGTWSNVGQKGFTEVKVSEADRDDGYYQTQRDLQTTFRDSGDDLELAKRRNKRYKTGVVQLRMAYGICLDSGCDMR